jgi:hypothetical protein
MHSDPTARCEAHSVLNVELCVIAVSLSSCSAARLLQTSGNDVFYRNPFDVSENLFVNVSSPSSSKYETVADFGGSPEAAAKKTEAQVRQCWRLHSCLNDTRRFTARFGSVQLAISMQQNLAGAAPALLDS